MSRLFLVRHGQASFLTEDYDRLSPLGVRQSELLGDFWQKNGIRPTVAYAGTLKRQQDTAAAVARRFEAAGDQFCDVDTRTGLNEYPADELMAVIIPALVKTDPAVASEHQALEACVDDKSRYRHIHRLLEAMMTAWVNDSVDLAGSGLPSWAAFSSGVREVLIDIFDNAPSGSDVAVFTSGGPIGIAVQTVLSAPELTAAALNWRVHNASVTPMTFSKGRASLDAFNIVEHLPLETRTYR
ncbi:MAG: histidine phosphatase family protein [Pseudomonadota bacterium]